MNNSIKRKLLLASLISFSSIIFAKVPVEDGAKLGTELTPMGANPAANTEGTIPKWTGKILGTPAGVTFVGSGTSYPNIYKDEKPLFSITKANLDQYKDKLSEGSLALFKKYPESYRMDIFPSHRDFRYSPKLVERTKKNVGSAELINGIDGLQNMSGGAPFPIPQDGAEVIWNARLNQPIPVADSLFDEMAVYNNDTRQLFRAKLIIETPYAYESNPVGKAMEGTGNISAYVFYEVLEPKKKKGEMVIVHEPLDQVKDERKAWVYIPGVQRVKRAPNVGYDTPVGPGGLATADDSMGFNGAMNRYDWKLIGKKELYIPYHSYVFDSPDVKYDKLLPPKHVNPDYMRFELHRVWVVEATLKKGERHLYAKRRFYMNEDNWLIVATDSYDGRGELWRVGLQNTLYDFFLKGYIVRSQFNYDLQADAYVASRLVNETRPSNYAMEIKGSEFYTPNNLKALARQ